MTDRIDLYKNDDAADMYGHKKKMTEDAESYISKYQQRLLMEDDSVDPDTGEGAEPAPKPPESKEQPKETPEDIDLWSDTGAAPGVHDDPGMSDDEKNKKEFINHLGGEAKYNAYLAFRNGMAAEAIMNGQSKEAVEYEYGIDNSYATDPGMMDPVMAVADLIAAPATVPGRAALRAFGTGTKMIASKQLTKTMMSEVAFGMAAGGFMDAAEKIGAGPMIQTMTGLIGPTATYAVLQFGRKGLANWLRGLATNNPKAYDELVKGASKGEDALSEQINVFHKAKDVEAKWQEEGMEMMTSESGDVIDLNHIRSPEQGSGMGSEAMQDLVNYADTQQKPIHLVATPIGPVKEGVFVSRQHAKDSKRLIEWYESFGFKADPDGQATNSMVREPVPLTKQEIPVAVERKIKDTLGFSNRQAVDITRSYGPEDSVEAFKKSVPEIELSYVGKADNSELRAKGSVRPDAHQWNFRWRPGKGGTQTFQTDSIDPSVVRSKIIDEIKDKEHFREMINEKLKIEKDRAAKELDELDAEIKEVKESSPNNAELAQHMAKREELLDTLRNPGPPVSLFHNSLYIGKLRKNVTELEAKLEAKGGKDSKINKELDMAQKKLGAAQSLNNLERPLDVVERFIKTEVEPGVARVDNIDLMKLDSSENIQDAIAKTSEMYKGGIDEARRGVITHRETEKMARLLGMPVEDLINRASGRALNAEELLGARKILVSSAEAVQQVATKIVQHGADDVDKFRFRRLMSIHFAVQSQVTGAIAEAGRALNALKIEATSSKLALNRMDEIMTNLPDGVHIDDLAKAISEISTPHGLNTTVRQWGKATTKDMFIEAWINGLLSGPITHVVNVTSNALTAAWMVPERLLAATFSKAAKDGEIFHAESIHQIYGAIEGIKDGFKSLGSTMKTNFELMKDGKFADFETASPRNRRTDIGDNFDKMELRKQSITSATLRDIAPSTGQWLKEESPLARVVDLIGAIVRTPGRMLTSSDAVFKSIGYRMELQSLAYRQARKMVDKLGIKDTKVRNKKMAKEMSRILAMPEKYAPNLHMDSIEAMNYQTFTKSLGSRGRAFQNIVARTPALKIIVPFVRTPTNILKFTMSRTPVAWMAPSIKADLKAGGIRRHEALARMAMGGTVMAITAAYAMEGSITGRGPIDPDLRRIKRNTGWMPYSIRIGDTYYAYGRIEPLGMLMGLAADMTEIIGQMDEVEVGELAAAGVAAISNNTTSKTWLRGVSETLRAIDQGERFGAQYINNFVSTAVPAGVGQIERYLDPEIRAVYNMMDALKQKIPGFSEDLAPRRNMWGEKIQLEGGWGWDMVSPIYTSSVKDSPVDEEILRMKMHLQMPRPKLSMEGVEVDLMKLDPTGHMYDDFITLMNEIKLPRTGLNLKQSLESAIKTSQYINSNDDIKQAFIRSDIEMAREITKQLIQKVHPKIKLDIFRKRKMREMAQ